MPRGGAFRERAAVERDTGGTPDQYGQRPENWVVLGTFWADFRETPGREVIEAGRLEANATGTLRLRRSALTASIRAQDRVRLRGRLWNIRGLPAGVSNRNAVIEITLEAGVAAGADATGAIVPDTLPTILPMTLA